MTIKETYPYTDESGKLLYEVVRYEPKDFRQRRPDGNGGWIWGLGDTPRILFNLPAVVSAKEIYLCQGERDAETAISLGMAGTTISGGEGTKWFDEPTGQAAAFVEPLRGKTVLLIPDNDAPGRIHAEDVVRALQGVVSKLGVVWVPVGKDLSDYIASGATSKDLNKLVELSLLPENSPVAKMQKLVRRRANLTAIESEKLVLGSVMAGRTPFSEIDHLASKDFSIEAHKLIFEALKALEKTGSTDRAAVVQHLEEREQLEKCGGLSGLLDMTEDLPTAYNVESHSETIQKRSADRKLLKDLCSGAEDMIVGGDTEEIRQKIITSINENSGVGASVETRNVEQIVGDIDKFLAPRPNGISCKPLAPLFDTFRGMHPGQLIILAGRTGEGKSSAATLITAYSAAQGHATDIISLEVSTDDALLKMACLAAKVPYLSVVSGQMSSRQKTRLYEAINQLKKLPLRIDDRTNWTVSKIRTYLRRRAASGNPVRVLCLDYLQLLQTSGVHQNRNLEIGSITRGLKVLALEFKLTVILLSQLSRDGVKAGRKPILSDLRESGSIEQDADIVIFVWQDYANEHEAEYERGAELILAKQRNGPIGTFKCTFSKPFAMFLCPGAISPLQYESLLS